MELIDGMMADDGMVFGPTINIDNSNLVLRFNADSLSSNVCQFDFTTTANVPTVDVTVDWGDGVYETINSPGSYYHQYNFDGLYEINIFGNSLGGFHAYNNFTGLLGCSSWGSFQLEDLSEVFFRCYELEMVPNNLPSGVSNLYRAFDNCFVFNDANITLWDTSGVTDMSQMFTGTLAFNQPIGIWDTSSVTTTELMFWDATGFNQPIGNWNTGNIVNFSSMFQNANNFNQPIGNWNTSNAINMGGMFGYATSFNQDIGNWNTANVVNMTGMFSQATAFDQNLTGWCVTNIVSEPVDFATGSALTTGNKPVWGTCPP